MFNSVIKFNFDYNIQKLRTTNPVVDFMDSLDGISFALEMVGEKYQWVDLFTNSGMKKNGRNFLIEILFF